ncbi:hypothetical protein ES705_02963 [subsurface metagenome]
MLQTDNFQEKEIDYKDIIYKILSHWYLFVIGIIISFIIVFFHNKFEQTEYKVSTTILINDSQTVPDPQAIIGFNLYNKQGKLQNEIEILKTYTLKQKVINALNLDVSYYRKDRFISKEMYNKSPFSVEFNPLIPQPVNCNFQVEIMAKNSVRLALIAENVKLFDFIDEKVKSIVNNIAIDDIYEIGENIENEHFNFRIILTNNYDPILHDNIDFYFVFNDSKAKFSQFPVINIDPVKESSIIAVSITGNNIQKSVDFLNELTAAFLQKEVDKKNRVADKTLLFLDNHLGEITDSLSYSEKSLQEYQSKRGALNLDFQTQNLYNKLERLQNSKAEILVNQKYYNYLYDIFTENDEIQDIAASSIMNVENILLNSQIIQLTQLQSELNSIKFNTKKDNPYIIALEDKITNSKKAIIENIKNEKKTSQIALNDLDLRIDQINETVNQFPKTQRELFGFERKFKLNDALYTYLLQKRSETLIAKASNLPLNEILDPARTDKYGIVSSNKKLNYIIGIILALIIPGIIVYLKYFLSDKVISNKDVEENINLPILGYILRNKQKENNLVFDNPNSVIAESFRTLRTNIQFSSNSNQVILITSSMKCEGKSFVSLNLASCLALNNKKTILLKFDLRNPILFINDVIKKEGLSNYLSGLCEIEDIIQQTHFENLDIITFGPIPPNPSELIAKKQTELLFASLRDQYDSIVVDTPPIGVISDALLLSKFSDVVFLIVRHNFTRRKILKNLINNLKLKKVENLNLIVNDINLNNKLSGYNYYGYGLNYDYSYNYKNN